MCQGDPLEAVPAAEASTRRPRTFMANISQTAAEFQRRSGRRSAAESCIALIALTLLVLVVFGQTRRFAFLGWDDGLHVVQNPRLVPPTWQGIARHWTEPYAGLYIPLAYSWFGLQAWLSAAPGPGGYGVALDPSVFHWGNVLLHVACTLSVFGLTRRLLAAPGAAWAAALVFALHPLQVESVAWISEARGLLSTFCALLALWAYVAFASAAPSAASRWRRAAWYSVASAAFVAALLAKPSAAAAPLMAWVVGVGFLRCAWRAQLLAVLPWLIVAAVSALLTSGWQREFLPSEFPPPWLRPLVAADALSFYLAKLLAPLQLGPDYGRTPQRVLESWTYYVSWIPAAALLALAAWPASRRVWLSCYALFVAALVPVLGLVPFAFQYYSTVADRYVYLAMLGPSLAAGYAVRNWRMRALAPALAGAAVLLGWMSHRQAGYWRDDATLFAHGLEVRPTSFVCHTSLGRALADRGEFLAAIEHYRASLVERPAEPTTLTNLGTALVALARLDEAEISFRQALDADERFGRAHLNLGVLLARRREAQAALPHLRRAVELLPGLSDAHNNLGTALVEVGRPHDALAAFQRAQVLAPGDPTVAHNLGQAHAALGQRQEAGDQWRRAVAIDAHFLPARTALANLYLEEGQPMRAEEQFRALVAARPENAVARSNLGLAVARQGRMAEAVQHFEAALAIDPQLSVARRNLAAAREALDQHDESP